MNIKFMWLYDKKYKILKIIYYLKNIVKIIQSIYLYVDFSEKLNVFNYFKFLLIYLIWYNFYNCKL